MTSLFVSSAYWQTSLVKGIIMPGGNYKISWRRNTGYGWDGNCGSSASFRIILTVSVVYIFDLLTTLPWVTPRASSFPNPTQTFIQALIFGSTLMKAFYRKRIMSTLDLIDFWINFDQAKSEVWTVETLQIIVPDVFLLQVNKGIFHLFSDLCGLIFMSFSFCWNSFSMEKLRHWCQ